MTVSFSDEFVSSMMDRAAVRFGEKNKVKSGTI